MDVKVDFVVPGVYVPEDWFPGNCSGCPFERDTGYGFDCVIKESLGIGYQCDCPAKAIRTPHGSLIDRDKIIEYGRSKGYNLVTLDLLEQIESVITSNKIEKGDNDA